MKVGLIGVGMVGGTLKRWFEDHTSFEIRCFDPDKGMCDYLDGCDAIFISIPVENNNYGQNLEYLTKAVFDAQKITPNVFIRSTVLPGTNDSLGTIAMPEFLTARRAYTDMCKLPILCGNRNREIVHNLFPDKEIILVKNKEAELAKFTHNCFGAFKVTYFNMIKKLCDFNEVNYERVREISNITGYLGHEHTQVPGHDGKYGYGGTCFGPNMKAIQGYLENINKNPIFDSKFNLEKDLISLIRNINLNYRGSEK